MTKSMWTSKTFWFNIITLVLAVTKLPEVLTFLSAEQIVAIQAVVNLLLRFVTSTGMRAPWVG